jgi:hypothetical protein
MSKALFIPAAIFFLLLVLVIKMPPNEIVPLCSALSQLGLVGWILAIVFAGGWVWNVRYLRRIHKNEMTRVADEKKSLQNQLHGQGMTSSQPTSK